MLTQTIADPRAWTADSIDAPASWYYPLPAPCLAAFDQARRDARPEQVVQSLLSEPTRTACAHALAPVLAALEDGRGFAIIEGPILPAEDAKLLYWIVGQGLGRPFAQNIQGVLLYDVRDTGQDLSQGARFSVTKYESSFHTDNSFGTAVCDYVGLLCLHDAKSGGRSQLVSCHAVHQELLARHPDELAILYQPFHVDRRGGVREGESPTIAVPILQGSGNELVARYLRYWIEAGHTKIGKPLSPAQVAALDTLDQCLRRRELRVEFDLKPGQMFFLNNRWIFHNRTAFEDYPEPERRRHLVRLWLQA